MIDEIIVLESKILPIEKLLSCKASGNSALR